MDSDVNKYSTLKACSQSKKQMGGVDYLFNSNMYHTYVPGTKSYRIYHITTTKKDSVA